MTRTNRPLPGWEASDCTPLTRSTAFFSLDEPNYPEIADSSLPSNKELHQTAHDVLEALGRIGELPGKCKRCGEHFAGKICEFKVSIIFNKGDGETPEIITLCRNCYIDTTLPAPKPEDDHQLKVVRFMHEQGSTQTQIASTLGMSQGTVSRILNRPKTALHDRYKQ
jgi:hypothetical protein